MPSISSHFNNPSSSSNSKTGASSILVVSTFIYSITFEGTEFEYLKISIELATTVTS